MTSSAAASQRWVNTMIQPALSSALAASHHPVRRCTCRRRRLGSAARAEDGDVDQAPDREHLAAGQHRDRIRVGDGADRLVERAAATDRAGHGLHTDSDQQGERAQHVRVGCARRRPIVTAATKHRFVQGNLRRGRVFLRLPPQTTVVRTRPDAVAASASFACAGGKIIAAGRASLPSETSSTPWRTAGVCRAPLGSERDGADATAATDCDAYRVQCTRHRGWRARPVRSPRRRGWALRRTSPSGRDGHRVHAPGSWFAARIRCVAHRCRVIFLVVSWLLSAGTGR